MASRGGQPGNKNATKNKPLTEAIRRAILQNDGKRLREIADSLVKVAVDGEGQFGTGRVGAFNAIAERIEGKVPQGIEADMNLTVNIVEDFGTDAP